MERRTRRERDTGREELEMGTKPDRQGKRKKKKKGDMEEMDAVRIGASRRIVANGTRKKW